LINKDADDWDTLLDPIVFAYRINIQRSTKVSPYELMYGVPPRLPGDIILASQTMGVCDMDTDEAEQEKRMTFFVNKVTGARQEARNNIEQAQEKQKRQYDIKHKGPEYKVGDKVVKYSRRRDTRMGSKLKKRFQGPYEVHEVLGKGVYRLRNGDKILSQVTNATNLKIWITQNDVSQSVSSAVNNLLENNVWVPDLNLVQEDREELRSGGWLNDRVIDAVNKLVNGIIGVEESQTSLLAQSVQGFDRVCNDYVQIVHDRDHWVFTGCIHGEILYADSLNRGVSPFVRKQMHQLYAGYKAPNGQLCTTILPCTQQQNNSDCGVYAAAFAFEIVAGAGCDLMQSYCPAEMRQHLEECLTMGIVIPFPKQQDVIDSGERKVVVI